MWDEAFFWRSWIVALITAVLASPVGCLMIWRKTAFFSDALSHAALAGILLGGALGIGQNAGVVLLVCCLAVLLSRVSDRFPVGIDVLLLIIGQTALCAGLIGLSYSDAVRSDLLGYLFGDVLSVTNDDLIFTGITALACAAMLLPNWKKQVFISVSPDMAQSEGVNLRALAQEIPDQILVQGVGDGDGALPNAGTNGRRGRIDRYYCRQRRFVSVRFL